MRPDVEDYSEVEADEPRAFAGSRAMSWMVLAVAVGGFSALAYYAYHSGSKSAESETLMVEADASPIKEAPVDAGGEQFPNKDKTIYDAIGNEGAAPAEKLLPEAERPVSAVDVEDSEESVPATSPAAVAAVAAAVPNVTSSTVVKEPVVEAAPQTVSEQPVAAVAKPVAEKKSFEAPQMINEKKIVAVKEEKPVAEVKVEAKPVVEAKPAPVAVKAPAKPKPVAKVAPASAGGSYKVQLGAFKSEEEAQSAWKKISAAHSGVLSGAPSIVKAEVNGGIFYRLRAGTYASSADAKAACASMAGQACIAVK